MDSTEKYFAFISYSRKNNEGTDPRSNFSFGAILPHSAKISAANWTDINSGQHNKTILISL